MVLFCTQLWRSGCLRPEILQRLRQDLLQGIVAATELLFIVAIDCVQVIQPPHQEEEQEEEGEEEEEEEEERESDMAQEGDEMTTSEMIRVFQKWLRE